jgi:hypothetical protein
MSSYDHDHWAQWSYAHSSVPPRGMSRRCSTRSTEGVAHPLPQPLDMLVLCPVLADNEGHVHLGGRSGHVREEFKSLLRPLRGSCILKVVGGFQ